MKRTTDRFGKEETYSSKGISGLKVFDGEDLEYQDRIKLQQLQQRLWIEQQKYEKEMKKQQEQQEEKSYSDQTLTIHRMRSLLEGDHDQKKKHMSKNMMEINKQLAEEKKRREYESKYNETQLDLENISQAETLRNSVYSKLKSNIDGYKNYTLSQSGYSGFSNSQA